MTLWILFALMTAAAAGAVLWPFGRKPRVVQGGSDRLVYQDQLREIARDHEAGLIGEAEAQSARIEISRRLLAAADSESSNSEALASRPAPQSHWGRRAAALSAVVLLPAIALGLYLRLGSPDIPGQSAFARVDTPLGRQSITSLVGQVEEHLAQNPNDGAGWEVLAPVYMRLGRFDAAVDARRKAIALIGDSATREADLGEALVAAANGVVTSEALTAFQRAIALDGREPKANYFLGLADEQAGRRDAAATKWRALLDSAPADAPWAGFVRAALARVTTASAAKSDNGPNGAQIAAADRPNEPQRSEMVRGMVQRLADRLHTGGGSVDDWLRLVQSYVVLGDRNKAKDAVTDAKRALSDHPDEIKRIDDLAKGFGLDG
jgi:cytochrome c-type biogenesis protein CcmH